MHTYILLFLTLLSFYGSAQQTKLVDFTKLKAEIKFDTLQKSVLGNVSVQFKIKENTDSIYLDARKFSEVTPIDFPNNIELSYIDNKITFKGKFKVEKEYALNFTYKTTPKKALYFWGWNDKNLNEILSK